ncbi:RNA-binding protein 25-like [Papaver somniferum]|uniref:RNA-binding protein 25-like n=1 Tax=Papaver somniferum TaxID=3469 RepID=UPI000E6FB1DA|nr:RNA-binding protein 25-like [Papaver somniferum]
MEAVEENMQVDDNPHDQQRRRDVAQDLGTNRYENPRELLHRTHNNFEREGEDLRQGQMILHGIEMLRAENEREREATRVRNERDRQRRREEIEERELQEALRQNNHDNRVRRRELHRMDDIEQGWVAPQEREMSRHRHDRTGEKERHDRAQIETNIDMRRRRREEAEEYEIQEAVCQNNHENRLRQARLKRPMREDIDQSFSDEILKEMIKDTITMSEMREFQEEYIALEEKQRDMESYLVTIPDAKGGNSSLLPRLTNVVASTSQGNQGRNITEMEKKLIAMGSADQAEFDKEYRDKQFQNHGGSNKIQRMDNPPESSEGQQPYYNKRQGTGRIVRVQINLPKMNTTIDKV